MSYFRPNRILPAVLLLLSGLLVGPLQRAFASATAQAGAYSVEVTTDPGVIPVGKARLHIRVTDSSGKPVEGATVRALTKMPGMDMGERRQDGSALPGRPGVYDVPAQFAMEGGYDAAVEITGPMGSATALVPLQTGMNTESGAAGNATAVSPAAVLITVAAALALAFVAFRVRRTDQRIAWGGILNRQVIGAFLLLGGIAAFARYAVEHWRRPGALTPIAAQSMDMSSLPPPPAPAPVTLATVTRGDVASTVRYTGTAVGYVEQDITARVTGNLVYMPLYPGDRVITGQVLARLDTSQSQPILAQKRAATAVARQGILEAAGEVEQAQAQGEQAHAELSGKMGALSEADAGVSTAQEERATAQAAIVSAQAQVTDARAQVEEAQSDQTFWKTQIARSASLYKAGAISGEEYGKDTAQATAADAKVRAAVAGVARMRADADAARAALRKAEAGVQAATSRVEMAQSELVAHHSHVRATDAGIAVAREKVTGATSAVAAARADETASVAEQGYAVIRSTIDGVVTQRLLSPGVLVSPGQAILRAAQIHPIRLQANVAEGDLSRVRVGSMVTVESGGQTARGRKPLEAQVTSVAPSVDPESRTGIVEAVVENAVSRFLPGQYVTMAIRTAESRGGVLVPVAAVQYRTPDSAGVLTTHSQPFVWVAEKRGSESTVRRRDIVLGATGDRQAAVTQGLSPGQEVVVSGGAYLADGDSATDTGVPADASGTADTGATAGPTEVADTPSATSRQAARVTVTPAGFQPSHLSLRQGVPAEVTFLRTTDATCAKEVVFPSLGIRKKLPLNQPVVVTFTPKSGEIGFVCGMNMLRGSVVAR